MKLKDMLVLLKDCEYMVLDLDSGLRTTYIPSREKTNNPQLRTLLNKAVKTVRPGIVSEDATQGAVIVEVANA